MRTLNKAVDLNRALPRPALLLLFLALAFGAQAARPSASLAACANPVACENQLPGTDPETWEVDGSGDDTIQGYATQMSTNKGGTVNFKIKSATTNYRIDIYRLGYYGGDGARLIQSNLSHTGSSQPACLTQASTGLVDCGNWSVSASWQIPSTAVSGVYIAHLQRNDTGGVSQIVFVVRDDSSHSDIVVQTSDATWQAYNTYGGQSLYDCTNLCPPGNPSTYQGAFKVSYNRPFHTADDDDGRSWLFTGAEYSMIRFLERNGYDASYISSSDVNSRGNLLLNHKIFMSSGHDEYWSAGQRANVAAARDAGVNLVFFTGNESFWKTRWEPSIDGSNTADRTLVSYKDTHFASPQDPVAWTGTWRDPRWTTAAVNTPENALTGQSFLVNTGTSQITVPAAYGKLRLWRNTAAARLSAGQTLSLAPNTLGYEWDVDADNGYRPAGEFRLSSTTVSGLEVFTDYGSTTKLNGTATHNLTMYRAPSGALVFGAGTVQWAWGLDDDNPVGTAADPNMQQATVNLFADMGAQPTTLIPGLVLTTKSTDTTAPTSTLSTPPSSVADGSKVTLSGTATDGGGGQVAGVEVSTDGGATWHEATGTTSWTYTWIAHGNPSTATIRTRAVDDSGNLETPGAGVTVTVNCPCSLWGPNVAPDDPDADDATPIEVGMKFTTSTFGTVSGIRFYKAATNTGTHTGSLWTADGTRLAQATFTNESASGWQTVTFANPVQVQPGTTYVASYYAPNGHYSGTQDYFWRAPNPGPNGGGIADAGPLHAVRADATTLNGLYSYSTASTFPVNSFAATNYWVDPVFSPLSAPGAVSNVSAVAGGRTSANVSWSAPTSGGPVTSYKITPYIGSAAQTATTITGSPPATQTTITGLTTGTTYTFTVQAVNPNGSGPESAKSNAVTPLTAVAPSAPTNVVAQPASQQARVTWTASAATGDSPITGQTVTPYIGSTPQTPTQVSASATSATVTGLTNSTSYTFVVTATNAAGTSPGSSPSNAVIPQATIFDFATPAIDDSGDTTAVELGVKFTADSNGSITGIRFYKTAANTGTHIGSLWTSTGTRLAQVTFTNESASGWQTALFSSPVQVTAGTTYIASYFDPAGHYSANNAGLVNAVDNPPLHAVANSSSVNGVYAYSSTSTFPSNSYNASNYWVDVMYSLPKPSQVTGVSAAAGRQSANVTWSVPTGGGAPSSYVVTPFIGSTAQTAITVQGGSTTSTNVTGLTTGTTYTFTVAGRNASGTGPASAQSNAVTPTVAAPPAAPTNVVVRPASSSVAVSWSAPPGDSGSDLTKYTVTPYIGSNAQTAVTVDPSQTQKTITGLQNGTAYTFRVSATNSIGTSPDSSPSASVTPEATIYDFATPTTVDSGDTTPVELGVKFQSTVHGQVTGIRFYKASGNTGTHTGSLWSTDGTRLAQVTFTGESASGWQSATFSQPVTINPGTTYIASYFDVNGHYSVTNNGLASEIDNGPLKALGNTASPNGVFTYGATSTFPVGSFNASDYAVDVLFQPISDPGPISGLTATAGNNSALVDWNAPTTGGAVDSYKVTPYAAGVAQTATTVTGSPPATQTTITGLTAGTSYTFTVQARSVDGTGPVSQQSNAVVPTSSAVAPNPPTGVSAEPASQSVRVAWSAPTSDGGSAITQYTVTPFDGSTALTPVTATASARSAVVPGLTNGKPYTFRVKATNSVGDSSNSAATSAVTPRAAIFDFSAPTNPDSGDTDSVVLGTKFSSDTAGSITGIRFYKSATNTGTHIGGLWNTAGQLLAQATFGPETASGWQSVIFSTPVPISANTTYVAGYLAPRGGYSASAGAFASSGVDNPPLHALSNIASPNGVYAYSATLTFPSQTFNATNYWVDVLFAPGT
ncbi:MAG TPA: DUF4082 domain-containing protein [Thermoleophilaceae bacterium]|jgi:hypothetical protein